MSAFLVPAQHIGALAGFAYDNCENDDDLTRVVNRVTNESNDYSLGTMVAILVRANVDSLQARYPHHGDIAGGFLDSERALGHYDLNACASAILKHDLHPVDICNMVDCLMYQCDNVPDWESSEAYWLLRTINDLAARNLGSQPPAKVTWDYSGRGFLLNEQASA